MMKYNPLFLFTILLICLLSGCTKHNPDTTAIPLIIATPNVILSESGCLNIYKPSENEKNNWIDPSNEKNETNCYEFKYISLTTQVDWLDKIFAKEACDYFASYSSINFSSSEEDNKKEQKQCENPNVNVQQIAKNKFNLILNDMKEIIEESNKDEYGERYADSAEVKLRFIGQRGKIAQFRDYTYYYPMGAVHGIYAHNYRVFDLEKKVELTLDDIVISKQKLLEKLREKYEEYYMEHRIDMNEYKDYKQAQEVVKNATKSSFDEIEDIKDTPFQLTIDGITFYFQPYEIGSFSEGVIELEIHTQEALGIIKEEYLLNY